MQLSQFYSHFGIGSHVTSGVFDRCALSERSESPSPSDSSESPSPCVTFVTVPV